MFSNALSQSPVDTIALINSYNQIGFESKKSDITKALTNLHLAQNLSKKIGYKKGQAISYMYEAGINQQQGFSKRALSDFYNSLVLFKTINDTFNIAKVNQLIANSLLTTGNYDSALKVYDSSLVVYEKLKKSQEIANVNNSIGLVLLKKNQVKEAISFFEKALSISNSISYKYGIKKAYYHLGLAKEQAGFDFIANDYFLQSLAIDKEINDRYGIALNEISIVSILIKQQKLQQAEKLAINAYTNAKEVDAYELEDTLIKQIVLVNRLNGNSKNVANWQDSSIALLKKQRLKENEYASNLLEIIKDQLDQRLENEKAIQRAERVSSEQFYIITVGTFILIILAVLVIMVFINFQKQKLFGRELRAKNILIEAQISELGTLNKEISQQNIMLEDDNKTKDKLLSIISHDLRNPLVNTKGILNLVNQDMVPEDEAKLLLLQLETQYMSTTSLLDNLLFWLKGQMLGKDVEKSKVTIFNIVKGLEDEHQLLLKRKSIQFNNMIEPDLKILADKEMIRIVLRNLISNAIKFTPQNGVIYVIGKHFNNETKIMVKDSGIGMTVETIQKITAKQYYTTAGTALEKGSGFGLMLCTDLVNRQGGKLTIESEFGKGSNLIITLPD
ncbi:MAG: tetratricopeptide repeat-containing sensor histidine kinase [Sphingobacteriia bacterium]|jgi:signal transduction histidine kinase